MNGAIIKIIEKINSVAILFIIVMFAFGSFLLLSSSSFTMPSAIGGFLLLVFGLLYSIFAYSFNQIHENYKTIIKQLYEIIKTWKSSTKAFEKMQRDRLTSTMEKKKIGERWMKEAEAETETEDESTPTDAF